MKMRGQFVSSFLLAFVVGGMPVVGMIGCDKTVEEHKVETAHPNGTTDVDKSKTVVHPDGSKETVTQHDTSKPS